MAGQLSVSSTLSAAAGAASLAQREALADEEVQKQNAEQQLDSFMDVFACADGTGSDAGDEEDFESKLAKMFKDARSGNAAARSRLANRFRASKDAKSRGVLKTSGKTAAGSARG